MNRPDPHRASGWPGAPEPRSVRARLPLALVSHRLGQTLLIIDRIALLGSRDGHVIEARAGDTIYTAPGEEHWHGAAPDRFMAHLGLIDGDNSDASQTTWGEKVTDADYEAHRTSTR
jgi:hypothetical protein